MFIFWWCYFMLRVIMICKIGFFIKTFIVYLYLIVILSILIENKFNSRGLFYRFVVCLVWNGYL